MNYKTEMLLRSGIKSYGEILEEENRDNYYECKLCGKTFKDKKKYTEHQHECALKEEKTTKDKRYAKKTDDYYECNICGKKFKDKKKFKKHQHMCILKNEETLGEEDYRDEKGEVPGEQDTGPHEYEKKNKVDKSAVMNAAKDAAKDIFGSGKVDTKKVSGIVQSAIKKGKSTEDAVQIAINMMRSGYKS